jgi:L-ascorbate metabolism protein UlaG (beta-lactamase superfamily)
MNPKVVIPMHRFKADPGKLARQIETRSVIRVIPLDIGETYRLED